jgi:hypothetical protein
VISAKVFNKVWHKELIFILKTAGLDGRLLAWISDYLSDRRQAKTLPGTMSNWSTVNAGVPQGSILGPLLFLVYINDIVDNLGSGAHLFADDTSLHIIVDYPQSDIDKISVWASRWLVTFSPSKSETMIISRKSQKPLHPQ